MVDDTAIDQRIKQLEAALREQELKEKTSARPFFTQSLLAALPIVLTVGLGFLANSIQSRSQHAEQLEVLAQQGALDRAKQEALARETREARADESSRSFQLQQRDVEAQGVRQKREFDANAAAAADRFKQEQMTQRIQNAAQQTQQAREFSQSLERQRRQAEVELILKASEVPTSLSLEQQDVQRARNLLWFADAGYIQIPDSFQRKLRDAGRIVAGQDVPVPVVQSSGGTAALDLITKFEGFTRNASSDVLGFSEIGYGHDLTDEEKRTKRIRIGDAYVDISNGITTSQAQQLLRQDIAPIYLMVDRLVTVPLKPSQRDALAVLVRNIGNINFERSSLLKQLNNGRYDAVPGELAKWNAAAGRIMPGLVRRRQAEIELWSMNN